MNAWFVFLGEWQAEWRREWVLPLCGWVSIAIKPLFQRSTEAVLEKVGYPDVYLQEREQNIWVFNLRRPGGPSWLIWMTPSALQ